MWCAKSGFFLNSSNVAARTIARPSIEWWPCVEAMSVTPPVRRTCAPTPNAGASDVRMAYPL